MLHLTSGYGDSFYNVICGHCFQQLAEGIVCDLCGSSKLSKFPTAGITVTVGQVRNMCVCVWYWRILARIAIVNQVIYDQFGGWFCTRSGGQNNPKLVINSPDLHKLRVLKFHSIHNRIFLWVFCQFSEDFWPFLTIFAVSSPDVIDLFTCTDGLSLIAAKLEVGKKNQLHHQLLHEKKTFKKLISKPAVLV